MAKFIGKLIVDIHSAIKNSFEDSESFLYGFFGQFTMNGGVGCGVWGVGCITLIHLTVKAPAEYYSVSS
jgi:hypothetical protein